MDHGWSVGHRHIDSRVVLYLANASNELVRQAMRTGELGQITTPRERRPPLPGVTWAADNGCFGKGYPGDDAYLAWLRRHSPAASRCLFATAPDVVGDAEATAKRSAHMLAPIRELGYPVAYVLQDGQQDVPVPWEDIDAVFLGGSDDFKLGPVAAGLAREAKTRGKYVHVGRVNSYKRLSYSRSLGADSADGTFVNKAPHHNLGRMRVWFDKLAAEGQTAWSSAMLSALGPTN